MENLRRLAREGVNVPSVTAEPQILPVYLWLWHAFCMLSERRFRIDFTPQPIQFSEIVVFSDETGVFDEVRREQLRNVVTALDRMFMDNHWTQVNKQAAAATAAAKRQR